MARSVRLTTFSSLLFCLSFLHSPLLALILRKPRWSSDRTVIIFNWAEDRGDPEAIYLQIFCNKAVDFPAIFIPLDRLHAHVSEHQACLNVDPSLLERMHPAICRLDGFRDSTHNNTIAETHHFRAPSVAKVGLTTSASPPSWAPRGGTRFGNGAPIGSCGSKPAHRTPPRGALIGGTFGGVALLATLIICFIFLYLRRKRSRSSLTTTTTPPRQHRVTEDHDGTSRGLQVTDSRVHGAAEAAENGTMRRILSLFRCQVVQNPIVDPPVHSEDYLPPEGERERLERVDREMEESRRQREILQSDLDSRSDRDTVSNGSEVGLDGEVERLKQQIEAISRRIGELEAERLEVEGPPPDYYSSASGR